MQMFFALNAIDVAVVIATVLGVAMLLPQALGMARTRDFGGVSAAWIGGGLAINGGWLVYAVSAGLIGLLPVSLGAWALYMWMAAMLAVSSPDMFRRSIVGAATVAGLFAAAGIVGGVGALGLIIALTYAAQFAPAAWSALVSEDVSGVSVTTWVMALIEALIWASYGAHEGDRALLFGGAGASVMSALVLLGLIGRRRNLGGSTAPALLRTR